MKKSVLILFLFLGGISFSQLNTAKLDQLFEKIESTNNGMGSISIDKDGENIYSKSIGYANLEQGQKADAQTKYRIGSLSKTFTATVILKLIENGDLKLKTKLKKFYPEVPNSNKITIEHLLSHRSGVFNFTNEVGYFSYNHLPISEEKLVKKIAGFKAQFKPGEKFQYSNSNYVLLTFIAEKVSGKKFESLINDFIVAPLQLQRTSFGGITDTTDNEAFSYNDFGGWEREKSTDMSVPLGAGAIESTPNEIGVFLYALFNGKILKPTTLVKMKDFSGDLHYGLGIYQSQLGDGKWIGHNGGIDGFQTHGFYHIEKKINVSYVSNGTIYPLSDIIEKVYQVINNEKCEIPDLKLSSELKDVSFDKYLGTYSSDGFPLKISLTLQTDTLYAQATGQGKFPLTQIGVGKFEFTPAGVRIMVNAESKRLTLIQQGVRIDFYLEED